MSEAPSSPKRRHILSSINPEEEGSRPSRGHDRKRSRRQRSASPSSPPPREEKDDRVDGDRRDDDPEDRTRPRRSRLKLKDHKSSRRRRSRQRSRSRSHDRSHRHRRRHRHKHREDDADQRRHHRSPTPPNPFEPDLLDPETAFRESLFDAMADDEGADYWAAVYGQPVHVYPNERIGPQGELERMTDEEYAAYVRQKMWEKTNAGLLEERARREEARKKKEADEKHQRRLQREMEESLRRGEERRQRRRWAEWWDEYEKGWIDWNGSPSTLVWPLEENGRRKAGQEIDEKAVRAFLIHGLQLEKIGEKAFVSRLKDERVRWHPDKIQQKSGGKVDEQTMRDVTAVFQIIDRLWSEMRPKD